MWRSVELLLGIIQLGFPEPIGLIHMVRGTGRRPSGEGGPRTGPPTQHVSFASLLFHALGGFTGLGGAAEGGFIAALRACVFEDSLLVLAVTNDLYGSLTTGAEMLLAGHDLFEVALLEVDIFHRDGPAFGANHRYGVAGFEGLRLRPRVDALHLPRAFCPL